MVTIIFIWRLCRTIYLNSLFSKFREVLFRTCTHAKVCNDRKEFYVI